MSEPPYETVSVWVPGGMCSGRARPSQRHLRVAVPSSRTPASLTVTVPVGVGPSEATVTLIFGLLPYCAAAAVADTVLAGRATSTGMTTFVPVGWAVR